MHAEGPAARRQAVNCPACLHKHRHCRGEVRGAREVRGPGEVVFGERVPLPALLLPAESLMRCCWIYSPLGCLAFSCQPAGPSFPFEREGFFEMQNAGGFAASLGREAPGPGCGELGVPARKATSPGAASTSARLGTGRMASAWPWVLPAGTTSALCASALSHAALCSREGGRAGAKLISQLCHRSVSQSESESLWAEPSPSGVTALPLPFLPPSRVLRADASLRTGSQHSLAVLPASPDVPQRCTAGGKGERDTAPHPAGLPELQPCSRAQRGWGENGSLSAETSRKAPWAP